MGFFDSVKKGATKAKIQGEIVLLDREIASIHRAFGVTLYDLLSASVDNNNTSTPALLKKQTEVAAAFEEVYKEIQKSKAEKDAKLKEIDHYEAKKDTRLPATNTQEKLNNFGKYVGETTQATKLRADIALLDRAMNQKKEAFGVKVFEQVVLQGEGTAAGGGWRQAMSSAADKEIAAAIDATKQKVAVPMNKKDMKNREIEQLDREQA